MKKENFTQRKSPDCPFTPSLCQTADKDCHAEWHQTSFDEIRSLRLAKQEQKSDSTSAGCCEDLADEDVGCEDPAEDVACEDLDYVLISWIPTAYVLISWILTAYTLISWILTAYVLISWILAGCILFVCIFSGCCRTSSWST